MPVSRLRLRLTGLFALSFVVALVVLVLSLLIYLRQRASDTLSADLLSSAQEFSRAIVREHTETGVTALTDAVTEAVNEWPRSAKSFVVRDSTGRTLGSTGELTQLEHVPAGLQFQGASHIVSVPVDHEGDLRIAAVPLAIDGQEIMVLAAASTADLREREEALNGWMLLAIPLALLVSLIAGYVLSRLALGPIHALGDAAAGISAANLSTRLLVREPADEVDRVASQFNGVLNRLQTSQSKNQSFLRQVAHQIRTPLTLVLGESELALERERDPVELKDALRRVQRAALQIRRRVSDLFLLAQAEAGEYPALNERVELDQVVLEVVDLYRARADALGQSLDLGTIDEADVRGDPQLLHEAVAEMVENACRHGSREAPVRITLLRDGSEIRLQVENAGPPIQVDTAAATDTSPHNPRGLGLFILGWIATVHAGAVSVSRVGDRNQVALVLPATAPRSADLE
jgi:two-component system heavy metal sensor histidine kinase CusS